MTFEDAIKKLDGHGLDSVVLMPRVIDGTALARIYRRDYSHGGFSYSDEDELRKKAKSGEFNEMIVYSKGQKKDTVSLNAEPKAVNAKFKVGDRVRSISGRGSYGTIKAIEYGDECIVDWDNGMGSRTPADGLKLANSSGAVANAWPSSYKVGDRIKFESRSASGHGVVGMERGYSPSIRSMRTGIITKDLGRGKWEVKTSDGSSIQVDEADFMGINSSNAIVSNAIAANAKVYVRVFTRQYGG